MSNNLISVEEQLENNIAKLQEDYDDLLYKYKAKQLELSSLRSDRGLEGKLMTIIWWITIFLIGSYCGANNFIF